MDRWFEALFRKIKDSFSDLIIVVDQDDLARVDGIQAELTGSFGVHLYNNEFSLRAFLNRESGKRVIIFRPAEAEYFPFDIEEKAEIIMWKLKDVFPKLNLQTLKKYVGDLPVIYEKYIANQHLIQSLNEKESETIISEWLETKYPVNNLSGFTLPWGIWRETPNQALKELAALEQTIINKLREKNVNWREIGGLWGRFSYIHASVNNKTFDELEAELSKGFEDHLWQSYSQKFYESYLTEPVTIDKVLHYIANQAGERKALICFDGMGFQEWFVIKAFLKSKGLTHFKEVPIYAMLPTITQISRRALFCGQSLIDNLVKEDNGYVAFTQKHWPAGMERNKKLFYNAGLSWNSDYLEYEYLGLIINLVDDVAHSSILYNGSKNLMQANLATLLDQSKLDEVISTLISNGYTVYLTSDHGTTWAQGNGIRPNKYMVEERAKRTLIYPNRLLANEFAQGTNCSVYESGALYGEKAVVFPTSHEMFANKGEWAVTHGGTSIEEVIIPFVEVLG